ncbi:MAG: glycosyltransferase [Calothrix sp. SM1_7_51]|nr:glycosyltransferase [Calothrix sp. SM1_7_51]
MLNNSSDSNITVGIPFYAGTKIDYLSSAVDSILSQTISAQEIHLIQDGLVSKELKELALFYEQKHNSVKHLVIQHNKGLPYALNFSIMSSSTNYYARMDDDDVSHPNRLKKQLEFLETHPEIDILGTWAWEFENKPEEKHFLRKMPTEFNLIRDYIHFRNPLNHPSVMFRRSVFNKIGLYDSKFGVYCDLGMWAKAIKNNVGITNLPEPLLYYRTAGVVKRRTLGVIQQAKARFEYNTISPKLNLLKALSLAFRLMPYSVQIWGYKNLR